MDNIAERTIITLMQPFLGRPHIVTSCLPEDMKFPSYVGDTLNETTIVRELQKAKALHDISAQDVVALQAIYKGNQTILDRQTTDEMRSNNKIVVNYAQAFTRNIVGYTYSSGTTYSARAAAKMDEVQELETLLQEQFITAVRKTAADDQSISGRGFVEVLPFSDGNSPIQIVSLSPINTEIVYSAYNTNLPVFAWNSYEATIDNQKETVYNVYTSKQIYTIRNNGVSFSEPDKFHLVLNGEDSEYPAQPNPMGLIPIVEYRNNQFNMGDWECAVSLFDAINSVASDSVNDVENVVKSILCLFGVDPASFDVTESRKGGFMLAFNAAQGITQDAKFISQPLDGSSVEQLRSYLTEAMMSVTGIPSRDTGVSGSDTGVSAQARTGANDIETVASNKVMFTKMAERQLLRIILNVLHQKGILASLSSSDVEIEIPRSKLDGVQSRVQSMSQLYAMGVAPIDVAKLGDITTDTTGFVKRWQDNLKAIKKESLANQPKSVTDTTTNEAGINNESV